MTRSPPTRLAILDWGIGGTGFYRAWRERRPEVPVLYWSDTGAVPYGKLPEDDLRERVEAVCRELQRRGARRVAVACNSGSTVVDELEVDLSVEGIVGHAVDAVGRAVGGDARGESPPDRGAARASDEAGGVASSASTSASTRAGPETFEGDDTIEVGVLGGRRTIRSGLYQHQLRERGFDVDARVAQPISGLVERGVLSGPELEETLDDVLADMEGVTAVLLACTHYPAVADAIRHRLPEATIVDPVDLWVERLDDEWSETPRDPSGADRFVTTGDAGALAEAAEAAFGVCPEEVREVELEG